MQSQNNYLVFEKSISRDWCLMNTELHQESFTKEFKKQFGWGFSEVVYEGKDNTVTVYNPPSQYIDGMRDFIISKINQNKKWLDIQSDDIIKEINEAEKYFKNINEQKLSNLSNKELLSVFKKYINWNYKIWPRFLIIVMFPIQMEQNKLHDKYFGVISTAIKARKLIEKAGPILEDFGTDFSKLIVKKAKINTELARYISYKEVLDYLERNILPAKDILAKRRNYYIVTNRGILYEDIGQYFKDSNYILKNNEVSSNTSEIRGNCAFSGKIKGKVKLILNKTMFKEFVRGEILVTSMTTPDYLPLMKIASAFITDEGGVTCHAAIVARELKKPCIIGTKLATQILKDGDLVEVDAERGIVKIIKRSPEYSRGTEKGIVKIINKSEEKTLAEKFMDEIGQQEIRPPIYTSSAFVHAVGWNSKKYFSIFYKDKTPFPLILIMGGGDEIVYALITKEKNISKEIFNRFWKNSRTLSIIENKFKKFSLEIEKKYFQMSYDQIKNGPRDEVLRKAKNLQELWIKMNALVFFSIYFDRNMFDELITELKIDISHKRADELWKKASLPITISFDKRRQMYVMSLIAKGESWDKVAEKCQYFGTTYSSIESIELIKEKLIKEYSQYFKKDAQEFIKKEKLGYKKRQIDNKKWLKSLKPLERKIVEFIQYVISLRDERKDIIMKAQTALYRVADKLFEDNNLPKNLIWYCSTNEIFQGDSYLEENRQNILNRVNGMVVLTHDNGSQEIKYGAVEKEKAMMNVFYMKQQLAREKNNEIKGQKCSSGKVSGVVRLIKNFELDKGKMKKGDILVTGMTRPEFVPLMKIAKAIVTDEGGITCHAAIVSRELGIPCIIGTKVGTQILKDNDLVEVDANKGIVKIIKKYG